MELKKTVMAMKTLVALACLFYPVAYPPAADAQVYRVPGPETVLSTLEKGHPRLMLNDAGLARIREAQKSDETLRRYIAEVMKKADVYCGEPALSYTPREGARLLSVGRRCMNRMYTLGLAWRLTGDKRYARKAAEDLLAVCALENWTPPLAIIYPKEPKYKRPPPDGGRPQFSFLDVSEMCHAVGIGYDWLYHGLTEGERDTIGKSLIRLGLEEGVTAYTGKGNPSGKPADWIYYDHNWNQVCNGGLIVGALAVAETDPDYARIVVPNAVKSLPRALATYGPDGAWPEGPSYWGYATMYTVFGLAALQSALGTDYGLSDIGGMSATGLFPVYTAGPTGMYLNFADSPERNRIRSLPSLFWLAKRYGVPFLSNSEHVMAGRYGPEARHVIWYVPPSGGAAATLDLDRHFRGPVEVAVFRSAWNDPDALFVGVKAGDNTFNHSHLDLGAFEMDAVGVRWARDLGSDDYSLPGYFDFYYLTKQRGGKRWSYYRMGSSSHNVPMLNSADQDELAKAEFIGFASTPRAAHVIVDLGCAYAPAAKRAVRGVAMVGERRAVLVQDEFVLAGTAEVAWGMTTDAVIAVDGDVATLTLDGKTLTARVLSPADAVFTVESAEREPPEKKNRGVNRLMVRLDNRSGAVSVAVLLSPHRKDGSFVETAEVKPLDAWK